MVEAQGSLVAELGQNTEGPFLTDDVDESFTRTGADAAGLSFLIPGQLVT